MTPTVPKLGRFAPNFCPPPQFVKEIGGGAGLPNTGNWWGQAPIPPNCAPLFHPRDGLKGGNCPPNIGTIRQTCPSIFWGWGAKPPKFGAVGAVLENFG